ncbi:hypothetical protein [Lentilitoribacter sp. EG35]|uniref:hypothetical protein n=1 Tax=Lentilitoribacter sp. EG35 TaxID=3234192 RepID=UPI0034611302
MRSYIADFNIKSAAEVDKFDLASAQAGVSNGRNERFLNVLETGSGISSKGKKSDLTDIILNQNIDYAALYEKTMQTVRDAEDAVERAMQMATSRYAYSQAALDEAIGRAAELSDGTLVARSEKDGLVYTLDGALVDQDEAAQIEWTGRERSLEYIQSAQDRADTDLGILTKIRQDEARLGEIREEMDSEPEPDRVKGLEEEAETIQERNEQQILKFDNNDPAATTETASIGFGAAVPVFSQ